MNRRTVVFCWSVITSAAMLLALQSWDVLLSIGSAGFKGMAALIMVGLVSEVFSVKAVVGSHKTLSSIAFLPLLATVLLFPLPASVLVSVLTISIAQFAIHRRPPIRAAFNVAQTTIATFCANCVFISLGGAEASNQADSLSHAAPAFLGLAFTFFFVNQLTVSSIIAFQNSERVSTMFTRMVGAAGANLLYDLLASPIAAVLAVLYINFQWQGIIVGVLPLLVIRHSYASRVALEQANKDLLSVLVKTIETRDPYTSGHSIRVSILAKAIAEDMDLSATKVDKIENAALVHDIGKVDAVYATIIRKEGSLSDQERRVIVTHAAKGAEFLETLGSFEKSVIGGVRHHHERYDGTGYPDGLSGENIPLAGRIIQLCNSIDAMLSDRPYRKALSVDHVRSELLRCAGTQFDPRIVDIILKRNTLERAAALVRPETGPTWRVAVLA